VGEDHATAAPLHSNRMRIDENAMASGIAMHCDLVEAVLGDRFKETSRL
jgi:hypothetical protein